MAKAQWHQEGMSAEKTGERHHNSGGPGCLEIEGCGKWCRPTEGNGVGKS